MGLAVGTAKYLLFIFNFIFFITGIAIIAVGGVYLHEVTKLEGIDTSLNSPAVLLIVVGVFVALISFFGCCGAIKHSYCMLITFAVILALVFILELAAGIAAYVRKDNLVGALENGFYDSLNATKTDNDKMKWWNTWQEEEKCCGVNNATDWNNIGKGIPDSCCNHTEVTTTLSPEVSSVISSTSVTSSTGAPSSTTSPAPCSHYTEGCLTKLENTVKDKIVVIGGVGVGIAFIQILGIVYACCLASAVKQ